MLNNLLLLIGLYISSFILTFSQVTEALHKIDEYEIQRIELNEFFKELEGTFVLFDNGKNVLKIYNEERAATRFIPASTFKIPNSLIALETGVADGQDFELLWDSVKTPPLNFWPESWRKDQTLKSAFQNSVVWYYKEIARRIGEGTMQQHVYKFDYGNMNIGGGIDKFWLTGDLRISAIEQVEFLKRFYFNEFNLSERAVNIVKEMMILEKTSDYILGGKTGTAEVTKTRELGWLVGYIEKSQRVYFYALNIEGETVWEAWPPHKRIELVHNILIQLNIIAREE